MLNLKNITYHYEQKTALNSVDIRIEAGESIALIGQNGCGKSTLLKILNGLIFPSEGVFDFENESITEKRLKDKKFSRDFHQKIGFVFQNSDVQLFCTSVREELAFGPRQMKLPREEVQRRVQEMLALMEIESIADEVPHHLSGGEMKRVAIGAALTMAPQVITLDEPLNNIDPKGKRFLIDILKKLNLSGKTLICATHEFDLMGGLFTRAIVFSKDHEIIADGAFETIVKDRAFLEAHNII